MEIKAKDMCPRCKYCLGMTPQCMYSCGKVNDGSELNIGVDVVLNCANFEWKDGKVEGKVSDICPKCKNCKDITRESNGVHVWLTEVECEDPYDGMTKTLDADSDICCSMFEPKPDKSCENDIYVTSYMGLYEEKKEKEPCDKISYLQHELEMDKLRSKIHQLEKEKAAHLKGIERLKKSQEKLQNQVKNLQTTNEESYKREEKLEDKVHKLERRLLDENKRFDRLYTEFLMPLARVLYPGEKVCKPYSEILEDIKCIQNCLGKNTKLLADVNKEAVEWKDKYEKLDTHYRYDEDIIKDIRDTISPEDNSIWSHSEIVYEIKKLRNENTSLNTINKSLAEDRKKLINYMRSLKIASDNYLKEFTYEED